MISSLASLSRSNRDLSNDECSYLCMSSSSFAADLLPKRFETLPHQFYCVLFACASPATVSACGT